MSGNIIKKAAAMTVAAALCASSGFFGYRAYAARLYPLDGRTDQEHVYLQGDETKSIQITDNFFGSYGYNGEVPQNEIFLPGDTLTDGKVEIDNQSPEHLTLYLYALPTAKSKFSDWLKKNSNLTPFDANTLSGKSDDLLKQISLEVFFEPEDGDKRRIYPPENAGDNALGTMDGAEGMALSSPVDLEDMDTLADSLEQAIELGTFAPEEKGTLTFQLVISPDAEGIIDNSGGAPQYSGFTGAVAMVDWVFIAYGYSMVLPVQPPYDEPKPVPQTGENALPYFLAAIGCGIGAVGVYAAALRKRRKEQPE